VARPVLKGVAMMPRTDSARSALILSLIAGLSLGLGGCIAAPEEPDGDDTVDGPEPVGSGEEALGSTVLQAAQNSCTTTSVKGLSLQIIAEGNCIKPGAFSKVPSLGNVSFGSAVFPYLEAPARDKLVASLKAHTGWNMTVNSMLRTVAQQYLLRYWDLNNKCGIAIAATPGNSNHETGLAIDISQYSTWKTSLTNHGFQWYGSGDAVHFDYVGAGAVSYKGLDVKAFQKLWNRNHPGDKITVDGIWGPQTESRMKKAPADGFPIGAACASPLMHDVDACAHGVEVAGSPLDVLCSSCSYRVCQEDATCCANAWSDDCVARADELCGPELADTAFSPTGAAGGVNPGIGGEEIDAEMHEGEGEAHAH
jgi:hypothetical protein